MFRTIIAKLNSFCLLKSVVIPMISDWQEPIVRKAGVRYSRELLKDVTSDLQENLPLSNFRNVWFLRRAPLYTSTSRIFRARVRPRPVWLQSRPGPTRKRNWNFGKSSARRETVIETSAQARADYFFFFDFGPDRLGLSDFKIGPFSCLQIINVFFLLMIYFSAIY